MLRIEMSTEQLAGARFAMSPVVEATSAVLAGALPPGSGRLSGEARRVLAERRLECLTALCMGYSAYLPEFLTPHPARYSPDLQEQLHRIATTPTEQVQREMTAFFSGGRWRQHHCPWLPDAELEQVSDAVRARLERQERDLTERLAGELEQFWKHFIAGQWSSVQHRLEADVARQARVITRHGMSAVFASLHPSLSWENGAVQLDTRYEGEVASASSLVLVPSVFTGRLALCAPLQKGGTLLIYPVHASIGRPTHEQSLAEVIGHTRLALLNSLSKAHTTTELARLHYLTPGSTSYHLTRLHAAELVERQRRGRAVYYWRSSRGNALLNTSG